MAPVSLTSASANQSTFRQTLCSVLVPALKQCFALKQDKHTVMSQLNKRCNHLRQLLQAYYVAWFLTLCPPGLEPDDLQDQFAKHMPGVSQFLTELFRECKEEKRNVPPSYLKENAFYEDAIDGTMIKLLPVKSLARKYLKHFGIRSHKKTNPDVADKVPSEAKSEGLEAALKTTAVKAAKDDFPPEKKKSKGKQEEEDVVEEDDDDNNDNDNDDDLAGIYTWSDNYEDSDSGEEEEEEPDEDNNFESEAEEEGDDSESGGDEQFTKRKKAVRINNHQLKRARVN